MNIITDKTIVKTSDIILRAAIYAAHKGKCFYTGIELSFDKFHIDHVCPKSKGGKDCILNYVATQVKINILKKDRFDELFIERNLQINRLLYVERCVNLYNKEVLKIATASKIKQQSSKEIIFFDKKYYSVQNVNGWKHIIITKSGKRQRIGISKIKTDSSLQGQKL